MKRLLFAAAASVLMLSTAQAADITEPAAYDWTGPYIGLQAGYGWGDEDAKARSVSGTATFAGGDSVIVNNGGGSIDLDGFIGGLHAGYNWQADSLVLGLEGDIEYADLRGDTKLDDEFDSSLGKMKQDIDWLGSLRLRVGYAMDRALLYATGGLAVGGAELSVHIPGDELGDNNDTKWGWTIGGGLEYALTDAVSARIEYRYTDLGNIDTDFQRNGFDLSTKADLAFHAVRAGLSWHF